MLQKHFLKAAGQLLSLNLSNASKKIFEYGGIKLKNLRLDDRYLLL